MVAPTALHIAALAATAAAALVPGAAAAHRLDRSARQLTRLDRRANTTDAAALDGQTFDYVVVGCVAVVLLSPPAAGSEFPLRSHV